MPIPTYPEVVRYCADHQLIGRVDTVRFYDYYANRGFSYRGKPVNWKRKAHEWAERQRCPYTAQKACEAWILADRPQKRVFCMPGGPTDDAKKYLAWLSTQFSPPAETG